MATGNPRGRPKGCVKTGGRVAGKSLDRQARQLVSSELAGSILATFEQLGGTADMVKWAKANRTVFYTQVLARLMPAPQKDDADFVQNNQFNVGNISDLEAARRVAFALAKAIYPDPSRDITLVEPEPQYVNPNRVWVPPTDAPDLVDEERTRWASELPLTEEQRRDNAVVRQTHGGSIESYAGSPGEQGAPVRSHQQAPSSGKPTAAELCRRMSRRSELL